MSTNQKYSARIHSRRQLASVDTYVSSCVKQLNSIGERYTEALPQVSEACLNMISMLELIKAVIIKVRESI